MLKIFNITLFRIGGKIIYIIIHKILGIYFLTFFKED
jgi:hypothetical protein